jgi:hypothetical protein
MPRAVYEAVRSAAADSSCFGSGSAAKTLVRACIGRLFVVAGTARARWLRQLAAVCWAEMLPFTTNEAGRALGPMLPASGWEPWPFCVLRDSCHAAVPDQPGSPSIGSGRWTGGSRRRQRLVKIALTDTTWMTWVLGHAAWVCLCQIASQQLKRPSYTAALKSSRLELFVCNCVLAGDVLRTRAG